MNYSYYCWSQTFVLVGVLFIVVSGAFGRSRLLFRLSVQLKELVVVDVEIEPFAVLTIRIVHNEIYWPVFCPLFLAIRPNIAPTESTL